MRTLILLPGINISSNTLSALNIANSELTRSRNFDAYKEDIRRIFNLDPITNITINHMFFLGGFIEGEGSINVSIKKHDLSPFGILIDPEFSIAQHVNGVNLLYLALNVFGCGRIRYKSGSKATLLLVIDNRELLKNKIVPFYKEFVNVFGSEAKTQRVISFEKLLHYIDTGSHRNLNTLVTEILPLWDSLRMQKGQRNQTFATLDDAIRYVKAHK